jgi:hypothetical protein
MLQLVVVIVGAARRSDRSGSLEERSDSTIARPTFGGRFSQGRGISDNRRWRRYHGVRAGRLPAILPMMVRRVATQDNPQLSGQG